MYLGESPDAGERGACLTASKNESRRRGRVSKETGVY